MDSPRSSSTGGLSGSPPRLDVDTLALLDSFLSARADEEQRFSELAASAKVAQMAEDDEDTDRPMMSVDEYRLAFGEDWQLSQFW